MNDGVLTAAGGRTVRDLLRRGAERDPGRILLEVEDRDGATSTLSWSQALDRSRVLAALLTDVGVGRGDRVHVHLPNRLEFLLALFAAAELGASIVPTNTAASADEVAYILTHAGVAASVVDAGGRALVDAAWVACERSRPVLVCEDLDLLGQPSRVPPPVDVVPTDDLAVMYTSGTTSRPKGVRITHANYVWAGEVVAGAVRMTPEDRVLTVLPLFHANAQLYTTMSALVAGATIVLLPRFSARRFLEQAARHRATVGSLFAAPIRMLLARDESRGDGPPQRLRVMLFAQNLTDAELARWDAEVGTPLVQLYGMTETVGPPVINPLGHDRRPHTMGRVSLGYACRVVRDDGQAAGEGDVGQLLVSGVPGVTLMRGYLHDPQATDAAFPDGWLRTGDIVRRESDGFLSFVDRDKDMIKRAGENVAASEVEVVLAGHPAVAEVAVFGIPDAVREEQIVAAVVPVDGEELSAGDLEAWCRERLASFRVPSRFVLRAALPRTAVGKVQKGIIRDELDGGVRHV
jgi:crotonobetaine/carnitine-CoA ligase